jgi:DNA-binding transcriptional LysR family regulator
MRNLTDRATAAAVVSLEINLEVNDTATLLDLVEAGLGVTLIAEAIGRQRRSLRTVPLSGGTKIDWTVSALALNPGPTNPAALELWRQLTRKATSRG